MEATIDALGHRTSYAYDSRGNQTEMQDPLGNRNTSVYDSVGNGLANVNPLGERSMQLGSWGDGGRKNRG